VTDKLTKTEIRAMLKGDLVDFALEQQDVIEQADETIQALVAETEKPAPPAEIKLGARAKRALGALSRASGMSVEETLESMVLLVSVEARKFGSGPTADRLKSLFSALRP